MTGASAIAVPAAGKNPAVSNAVKPTAAINKARKGAPLPVNLSRRPDLETLTVSNPSLEAYDELIEEPEENSDPQS